MSYISSIRNRDKVLIWERTDEGRVLKTVDAPFYFYVEDEDGEHTTMYGKKVTRLDFDSWEDFTRTKKHIKDENEQRRLQGKEPIKLYESDIPPDLKVLSERYYNVPAPKLNVTFLDIEVDYKEELGFSSVENPYAEINSVAFYHRYKKKYVVLVVAPPEYNIPNGDASDEFLAQMAESDELPENLEVYFCRDEKELLLMLLVEIEDSDVLAGWNSDFFDIPYIGMRILKTLDKIDDFGATPEQVTDSQRERVFSRAKFFRKLDFKEAGRPSWRIVERFGMEYLVLDTRGRVATDYLDLFKKYEVTERRSYKLESIADEILPEMPKLEYEGSLARLYRDNLAKFVRYNLRDTEILDGFETKLGYVDVANTMYHMSTGLFKHVTGTLKLAELATINYCHHELGGLIVNDNSVPEQDGQIEGAIVLLPQIGMHDNIGSIDITSLYPSAIRSINISPETLIGQFNEKIEACREIAADSDVELTLSFDDGGEIKATAKEWRKNLIKSNYAISGYGTVFDQAKEGIIPSILSVWFNTRKEYQKQMREAKAAGDTEKAAYCNRLQYVFKIKLNSFYGALNNKHFRFYDLRMGESTTGTGRMILLHQCSKVTEILDGEYAPTDREVPELSKRTGEMVTHVGYSDKWSVVYGDTDSTYFVTHTDTPEEAIIVADEVGKLCNDSFPEFMRNRFLCGEGYDSIIKTGREIVSDRGIFVKKKRYILHIIDNEGEKVDKIKVMGLDTKKTTLPKAVSDKLNGFVERLLKGEDWDPIAKDIVAYKEFIETTDDISYIGLPKGVKKVEIYTKKLEEDHTIRVPGHVRAAIHYNIALMKYNDKESIKISSGMKIRVYYIEKPIGKFKSIAIPVDIETVPDWFEANYDVNRKMHIERLVDNPLGNIIEAIGKKVPSKQGLFVDSVLEY